MAEIIDYLGGLPSFAVYFALGLVLIGVFAIVYVWCTPHREFALIRQNNPAAGVAFGGALLGFVLPLHSVISHSVDIVDCALWGIVALVVQLFAFFGLRLFLRDLPARIERGELATAILAASVFVSIGLLNAACMSY